ncbi:type 1 glutamine amidotransferase [Actinobacteria bacterium YIM 96077]|uniref:Protease n=1 Tax=Phytoactinopolyspora halophila TaxID=1981511 RepID=A0A329QCE3_9ACTN|nr:type 1 glutamine amidotransferase domain-containing protein [Phytoactinopolyspora halophila]AYY15576.1 type 1 glutamine amidotransferase [Actinobacteria bacterium YIM 96077]RAW09419.1 protease [Phytoactinopolyspora halophila]
MPGQIGILIADLFDEQEFIYPFYRVQEAGFAVTVIGSHAEHTYRSKAGFPKTSDAAAVGFEAATLDGLIVPGGFAPDYMRRDGAMLSLVAAVDDAAKPLGAICHAGWVLISAGVAKGRQLTGYSSTRDDLVNAGASYSDERVVTDGNLVTAQHYVDLPGFTAAFLGLVR